jgi:hypothetical protein
MVGGIEVFLAYDIQGLFHFGFGGHRHGYAYELTGTIAKNTLGGLGYGEIGIGEKHGGAKVRKIEIFDLRFLIYKFKIYPGPDCGRQGHGSAAADTE